MRFRAVQPVFDACCASAAADAEAMTAVPAAASGGDVPWCGGLLLA
jgi:hypothetical protein